MAANKARNITRLFKDDRGWIAVVDNLTEVLVERLPRPDLLRAAKLRFPEIPGNRWFRITSEEVLQAIESGIVPHKVTVDSGQPPTERQIRFLQRLCHQNGISYSAPRTKEEASEAIEAITQLNFSQKRDASAAPSAIQDPAPAIQDPAHQLAAAIERIASGAGLLDEQAVEAAVERALEKRLLPTQVEVKLPNAEVRQVQGNTHKVFPKVLLYVGRGYHVLLVGPAGSGKSTIAQQVYNALGYEGQIPAISFGPGTLPSKLFGFNDAHGNFNETPFYGAFTKGTPFLADELDNGHPGTVAELNQSLSNGSAAFACGQESKGNGFVLIATANTYGRGGDRLFVGRNQLDAATLDRFKVVTVDYDEQLESTIALSQVSEQDREKAEQFIELVRRHRRNVLDNALPVIVSPRTVIDGVDLVCNLGFSPEEVIEDSYLGGLSDDVRRKVTA